MCSNDHDWEEDESYKVTIEKQTQCDSCHVTFPVGTQMVHHKGWQYGEEAETNGCRVCEFGNRKPDHHPLHLCWGWGWDDQEDYEDEDGNPVDVPPYHVIYAYLTYCFENNEHPTLMGVGAALKQYQDAQALAEVES
jgi:hypothetical protein